LSTALAQTATLWPTIASADDWVHKAAKILKNEAQLNPGGVQRQFRALLGAMTRWKGQVGEMETGIEHFLKVTRSYWSGLFHCYTTPGLPKTNNDLEHVFGSWRHHQRRRTGRKVAPASLVVRGSVQLVAAIATQLRAFTAAELATVPVCDWHKVRSQLEQLRLQRVKQRQFRRSSATYLTQLEVQLLQLLLLL